MPPEVTNGNPVNAIVIKDINVLLVHTDESYPVIVRYTCSKMKYAQNQLALP
jgi:hypothetical protein